MNLKVINDGDELGGGWRRGMGTASVETSWFFSEAAFMDHFQSFFLLSESRDPLFHIVGGWALIVLSLQHTNNNNNNNNWLFCLAKRKPRWNRRISNIWRFYIPIYILPLTYNFCCLLPLHRLQVVSFVTCVRILLLSLAGYQYLLCDVSYF